MEEEEEKKEKREKKDKKKKEEEEEEDGQRYKQKENAKHRLFSAHSILSHTRPHSLFLPAD